MVKYKQQSFEFTVWSAPNLRTSVAQLLTQPLKPRRFFQEFFISFFIIV